MFYSSLIFRPGEIHKVSESQHEDVYGTTFAEYTDKQFEEFLQPLLHRLSANGVKPEEFFGGKKVLDAGCGGGRGSVLALQSGARHVTSVDFSSQNCVTTANRLSNLSLPNARYEVIQASLEDLPFDDSTFDVIWFNGVLQHVARPTICLAEVIRVLRAGGKGWLYVYGAGGFYWRVIREFRKIFADWTVDELIATLTNEGVSQDRIAEAIDDWKAPYLRTYRESTILQALAGVNCNFIRLMRGVSYDTNEQRYQGGSANLLGEGDLRFIFEKLETTQAELSSREVQELDGSHLADELSLAMQSDLNAEKTIASKLQQLSNYPNFDRKKLASTAIQVQLRLRDVFLRFPTVASALNCMEPI